MILLVLGIDNLGSPIPCETYKIELLSRIGGTDSDIAIIEPESNTEEELSPPENEQDSFINRWISSLLSRTQYVAESSPAGNRDNIMFNKAIIADLSRLLRMLPMWCAAFSVMFSSDVKTASSAYVESYFKNVKQGLGDIIPCSADVFIQNNIDMNNGAIKLASTKYVETPSIPEIENACLDDSLLSTHAAEILENEGEMATPANSTDILEDEGEIARPANSTEIEDVAGKITCFENDIIIDDEVVKSTEQRRLDETFGSDIVHLFDEIESSALSRNSVIDLDRSAGDVVNDMNISSIRSDDLSGLAMDVSEDIAVPAPSPSTSNTNQSMNEVEAWSKKRKPKESFYLRPAPHFKLLPNVKSKKLKIGILQNLRNKLNLINIRGQKFLIEDTSTIDSFIQILTAAYAYYEQFRKSSAALSNTSLLDIIVDLSTK